MTKPTQFILIAMLVILSIWIMLSLFVQMEGPYRKKEIGNKDARIKVLIVYDPDPFYNLDQQLCESFGKVLAANNFNVTIASVVATKELQTDIYSLYVICANTYNWDPDWAIIKFINKESSLLDKKVVALTLGAGSTKHSQKTLEKLIIHKKALLIDSKSFWLNKPNDETRLTESNVKVAQEKIEKWALEIAAQIE